MSTMRIRNVPESVSTELKARAAASGRSVSDYLLEQVTRLAARPTLEQALARARNGNRDLTPAADILARARDDRP